MRIAFVEKYKPRLINLLIIIAMIAALDTGLSGGLLKTVFNPDIEVQAEVREMFQNRNIAIINGDIDLIKSMYDTNTKYGTWAYEYEYRKVKYLHNWEKKQGAKFIEINPTVVFRSIKDKGDKIAINLLCSTEYKYTYEGRPDEVNTFRIGTYHVLDKGIHIVSGEKRPIWYVREKNCGSRICR
ncbi:MAG: hypothetical protein K0Q99_2253 [Clostridia bacterium]|nr:hypothetical protein [Clostridia bacterium]